jgi:glycosyltransferase involved in cell wall biosynthesis
MVWDKGIGEFVQAARILKTKGIRARFVLTGGMDNDNPTAISAAELQSWQDEGLVEWWGHREDMPAVFASSHVVVLPSYHEGLPKSLMEAAACARPLVATQVRGCREIVKDGDNGFLVPLKNSDALADKIAALLNDASLRARMGARGRDLVEKEFRVELIASDTIAVYRRLLTQAEAVPLKGVQLRATRT